MVDKTIKVSVLEGDLALLSTLGFPLPLCIQLQLSCLKIDEAMWTAKSTPGGFSVNLFWPTPAPEKKDVQPKRRRKRKRRAKARSQVTVTLYPLICLLLNHPLMVSQNPLKAACNAILMKTLL